MRDSPKAPASAPDAPPAPDAPDFTPVPSGSTRHDGWTPDRQRAFIAMLRRVGGVAVAARSVGKTPRSAYKLRTRPGAEDFADAWDDALDQGVDATCDRVIARAFHGEQVPIVRGGRVVATRTRHYDRLAIAVLNGLNSRVLGGTSPRALQRDYREARREAAERLGPVDWNAVPASPPEPDPAEQARLAEARKANRAARLKARREARKPKAPEPRVRSL